MAKLLMLRGLPASGKTTYAKDLVEKSGNYVRVNRDSLRDMLHFGKWTGRNESFTYESERLLVINFLISGCSVIVDDTNLTRRHQDSWREIARQHGATFDVYTLQVSVEECIRRDAARENPVGRQRILEMARLGRFEEAFGEKEIIVDLDGTLADISHRRSFVAGEKKDWKSFFGALSEDSLRTDILDIVLSYQLRGCKIIVVSARPEEYRKETEQWLSDYDVPFYLLLMRPRGDSRPDDEIKQRILDDYFDKDRIVAVIDDRPRVIRMWRRNGLYVIDVGAGEEF